MKTAVNTRRVLIAGTAVVVGIYLVLAFTALLCVAVHAGHQGHLTHSSPLCTWACQANNSAGLITLVTPALPILLLVTLLHLSFREYPTPKRARLSSRSPPRFPF